MKYRLIASDYDDTLLRSDNTVSKHSIEVIAEYRRRGGIFTISTGRSHSAVQSALRQVGITDNIPVISNQGSLIKESIGERIYIENNVGHDTAERFISDIEGAGYYMQMYFNDKCFSNDEIEFTKNYARITGVMPVNIGSFRKFVKDNRNDFNKLMVIASPEDIAKIKTEYRPRYPELTMEITGAYMLEVYNKKAGKGSAVKYLAEMFNIPVDSVMTFGDSPNDISMLEYAGFGVAVANAHPDVIKAADYVTLSNNDDGVAAAIEKFCFNA